MANEQNEKGSPQQTPSNGVLIQPVSYSPISVAANTPPKQSQQNLTVPPVFSLYRQPKCQINISIPSEENRKYRAMRL